MGEQLDNNRELDLKIEVVRELLYKKIEENIDKKEIQQISESLDILIVDYLGK